MIEENIKQMIAAKGYDNGSVLWPLRAALTGMEKSPGPFEVASVLAKGLGKETVLERIKVAINKLS
jgi:glutamyl-tRNA synthetase